MGRFLFSIQQVGYITLLNRTVSGGWFCSVAGNQTGTPLVFNVKHPLQIALTARRAVQRRRNKPFVR